ncbi:pyridoxamine 5'-phosphate oxidase [Pusillimonas sp. CC-YST705]|uniref:Pyridoxine/pyridoxamine 5'-phosphate oxidase n=1 Tax=Mesopusillimonas faecipullorum TaxID=2755040 RepID=A0ABS8CEQ7_9BURK|nr:pyridoxamine 5'-phosphate oxidase [Mesopusillimonas faecipullorum]MCB5364529.1 pyridoxamine 5'-phosphate oxidase [Mesopusillimonas faecipullorum]
MSIADLRTSYDKHTLLESDVASDPLTQFSAWLAEALAGEDHEPNAMTLATADDQGRPSARIVLLKGVDPQGLVFFTNYQSRKGGELTDNPHASLLFFWPTLERQVRIEGRVERIQASESDAYFHSRPLGSRIGAWASPQSQAISRDALEARWLQFAAELGDTPQRPSHWGGYRLRPERLEFWQGRPSRMHDRIVYERDAENGWRLVRLAP